DAPLPDARAVTVRIPHDYQALLDTDVDRLRAWRLSARRAFLHYLARGFRVSAFVPDGPRDGTYLLTRAD
ncbi:MAG TPA: hypothetical protein VIH11_03425, partial [Gemmatimonadaceae bacterium]